MAQEPSEGCFFVSFDTSAAGALRAALATWKTPLIEVKVLSLSIVSLSSFVAAMKMIWWVDF
jgi:hypothetical protein